MICTKRGTVLNLAAPIHLREAHRLGLLRQQLWLGIAQLPGAKHPRRLQRFCSTHDFGGRALEGVAVELAEHPSDPGLEMRARNRRDRDHLLPQVATDLISEWNL